MMVSFKQRLGQATAVLAPGVYDPLTALLVEQAGFEAAYISGASVAYTQLGRPDLGLVSLDHLTDVVARIRERVVLPLIVDADTGFGNALNVQRTVRLLERAGATAIQLEDQSFPKRCGHLAGKGVITSGDMVGKIRAAVDARASIETLIIGRTDAIGVEGFEPALERAALYLEAGVDVLFVEAPRSLAQMRAISDRFSSSVPLVANIVEGGDTPILDRNALSDLGFRLVIAPGAVVRAVIPAVETLLKTLHETGATRSLAASMTDLKGVNARVGLADLIEEGRRYDSSIAQA